MTEFTASNGITIRERNDSTPVLEWKADGRYCTDGSRWYAVGEGLDGADPGFTDDSQVAKALRECFQHERDEELGRWRCPTDPDYVVYAAPDGDGVSVLNERTGSGAKYSRIICASSSAPLDGLHAAAHAYFEAHPERKPWEDANPGDIWVVSVEDEESFAVHAVVDILGPVVFKTITGRVVNMRSSAISGARRIWPEDAS